MLYLSHNGEISKPKKIPSIWSYGRPYVESVWPKFDLLCHISAEDLLILVSDQECGAQEVNLSKATESKQFDQKYTNYFSFSPSF